MFDEGINGKELIRPVSDPLSYWTHNNVAVVDDYYEIGPDGYMYQEFLASIIAPSLSDIVEFYISFEYKYFSGVAYMRLTMYSDEANLREYTFPLEQRSIGQWSRIVQRIPLGILSSEYTLNKLRYTLLAQEMCHFKNLSFKVMMVPGGISQEEKDRLDNFRDKTVTYGLDAYKPRLAVSDDVFESENS
jgi:hypothetical protein